MYTQYWIACTKDEYELPVAVADTAEQLAARIGISKSTAYRLASTDQRGHLFKIIKIDRGDDDDEGDEIG